MTNKLTQEEKEILQGLQEILKGESEAISPEVLVARRRGRPPLPAVKVGVKIRLDSDLLGVLRRSGAGWQTRINETLRREFMTPRAASTTISLFEQFCIELPGPEVRLKDAMSTGLMHRYQGSAKIEGAYVV